MEKGSHTYTHFNLKGLKRTEMRTICNYLLENRNDNTTFLDGHENIITTSLNENDIETKELLELYKNIRLGKSSFYIKYQIKINIKDCSLHNKETLMNRLLNKYKNFIYFSIDRNII